MYKVELVDVKKYNYYTEQEILNGLVIIRNLVDLRISSDNPLNYIVISNDSIAICLQSADDELFGLYEKLYNKIKSSCRSDVYKRYYEDCDNIVPEIEVIEEVEDKNLKVYNEVDISGVKFGAELSLKAPLFGDMEIEKSECFNLANKILTMFQSTVVTTGEIIKLFSTKDIDMTDKQYIFISLNYMSEEVNKLYNKFKEWGNENVEE